MGDPFTGSARKAVHTSPETAKERLRKKNVDSFDGVYDYIRNRYIR